MSWQRNVRKKYLQAKLLAGILILAKDDSTLSGIMPFRVLVQESYLLMLISINASPNFLISSIVL